MATVSGLVCKACGHDQCHHIGYGAFCAASHCECGGYFVAPVAPDPGLREAIAKRIKAVEHSELVDLGYVEAITTAVLAVLAERGVR